MLMICRSSDFSWFGSHDGRRMYSKGLAINIDSCCVRMPKRTNYSMARETKGFVRRMCPRQCESGERYDDRQRKKASVRVKEIQQVNRIERLSLQVAPDVKRCQCGPRRDRGRECLEGKEKSGTWVGLSACRKRTRAATKRVRRSRQQEVNRTMRYRCDRGRCEAVSRKRRLTCESE